MTVRSRLPSSFSLLLAVTVFLFPSAGSSGALFAEEPAEISADDLMASVFGGSSWAEATKQADSGGEPQFPPEEAPVAEPSRPAVDEATRRELEARFASLSRSLSGMPQLPNLEDKTLEIARMPFAEGATLASLPGEPAGREKKKKRKRFPDQ